MEGIIETTETTETTDTPPVDDIAAVLAGKEEQPEQNEPEEQDPLKFASRFAALSKKEKALMQREQALKEQEKELNRFRELKGSGKLRPDQILSEYGLTLEEIQDYYLKGGEDSVENKVTQIEKKFESKFDEWEAKQKEAAEAAKSQAVDNFKKDIQTFLSKPEHSEKYELINTLLGESGVTEVYNTIEAYFEAKGVMLDFDKAADYLESHLEKKELEKLASLKKLKSRFEPQKEVSTQEPEKLFPKVRPNTLSNIIHAPVATPSPAPGMTREERLANAVRAFSINKK